MIDTASLRQKLIDLAVFGWHGRPLKSEALPAGWTWTTLGNLTELITSGSRSWAQYYVDEKTDSLFLRMGNLSRGSFDLRLDELQYVALPKNAEGTRTSVLFGDLLFSITAEIGMMGLIPEKFPTAYINQHTALIRFKPEFRGKYFPYCLLTTFAREQYESNKHGLKSSFRLDQIADIKVPLPPIAEQQSIVKRLEELLALEREIAADSAALDDLVAAAKRKILGLAISGKLVPKMGVWQTCSFEELVNFRMGKTPPRADRSFWDPAKYPWVSISDMIPGGIVVSTKEAVSEKAATELLGGRISKAGTLIMSFKLTIGRVSVLGVDAYHNEAIISIFPKDDTSVDRDYLKLILPLVAQDTKSSPAVMGNTLNKNSIARMSIPLPPLAEQKAIVARVEELHAVLDAIID